MNPKLIKTLQVLRLLDGDANLSITNIALLATLARLLTMPAVDTASLLTFVATLVGYQVKRFAAQTTGTEIPDEVAELKKAIDSLKTKTAALEMGQRRPRA